MRLLALMVVAALWGAPALAETKDGPDGFGPIKFGMTKEEAWAAIGGEGEWTEEGELTYTLPFKDAFGSREIAVSQSFKDEKASHLHAGVILDEEWSLGCIIYLSSIVSYITDRYGVSPVRLGAGPIGPLSQTTDYYSFVYKNHSSINVAFNQYYYDKARENLICSIYVIYYSDPFSEEDYPF